LRPALVLIAVIYIARGLLGIPVVSVAAAAQRPYAVELRARVPFMLVTSVVCLGLGLCYAVGAARLRPP